MANQTKKPLYASWLYIALSLCVLAVVAIGAYSAVNELFYEQTKAPEILDTPLTDLNESVDLENNESEDEIPVQTPPSEEDEPEDDPAESETPEKDTADKDTSAAPQDTPRIYMAPVNSEEILKGFTVEELVYSTTMNDYRTHTGIDYACNVGDAVCALTDGVVESIHADPLMGQTIVLNHGGGLKSVYQNLSLEIPEGILAGTEVHAGDLIGAVGDTALIECAEESHLHFEIREDDVCVDPTEYLK